jgi:hypothetical protein
MCLPPQSQSLGSRLRFGIKVFWHMRPLETTRVGPRPPIPDHFQVHIPALREDHPHRTAITVDIIHFHQDSPQKDLRLEGPACPVPKGLSRGHHTSRPSPFDLSCLGSIDTCQPHVNLDPGVRFQHQGITVPHMCHGSPDHVGADRPRRSSKKQNEYDGWREAPSWAEGCQLSCSKRGRLERL